MAKIAPIVDGCGWLRHCRDEAATLPEPEWYAMLSLSGRCAEASPSPPRWSQTYPGYTPQETDQKLLHAWRNRPGCAATSPCRPRPPTASPASGGDRLTARSSSATHVSRRWSPKRRLYHQWKRRCCRFPWTVSRSRWRGRARSGTGTSRSTGVCRGADAQYSGAAIGNARMVEVKPGWSESARIHECRGGRDGE